MARGMKARVSSFLRTFPRPSSRGNGAEPGPGRRRRRCRMRRSAPGPHIVIGGRTARERSGARQVKKG